MEQFLKIVWVQIVLIIHGPQPLLQVSETVLNKKEVTQRVYVLDICGLKHMTSTMFTDSKAVLFLLIMLMIHFRCCM